MSTVRTEIMGALERQAVKPPGGDPYIAAFDKAMISMLSKDTPINSILALAESIRPNTTPNQMVNLLLRSTQYLLLREGSETYPEETLLEPEGWVDTLNNIASDEKLNGELTSLLSERNTTTTIPNRYIGLRTVVNTFFGGTTRMLDVGCSIPIGLDSARREDGITQVIDHTDGSFVTQIGNKPISYEVAVGTDRTNPFSEEAQRWREACGCYPQEFKNGGLKKLREREMAWQDNGITFVQGDITRPDLTPKDFRQDKLFRSVQMSTMLYQLTPEMQLLAMNNAFNLLEEGGLLIVQDFVEIDETSPTGLRFLDNWGTPEAYKTIAFIKSGAEIKPLDLLHWDSGRCREVFPGKDFHILQEAHMGLK